jgi:hypothetical protein
MITLPVTYSVSDPNRVVPIDAEATMVWSALKADKPIPAAATKGSVATTGSAGSVVSPSPTPSAGPSS